MWETLMQLIGLIWLVVVLLSAVISGANVITQRPGTPQAVVGRTLNRDAKFSEARSFITYKVSAAPKSDSSFDPEPIARRFGISADAIRNANNQRDVVRIAPDINNQIKIPLVRRTVY